MSNIGEYINAAAKKQQQRSPLFPSDGTILDLRIVVRARMLMAVPAVYCFVYLLLLATFYKLDYCNLQC
jgi:hypothetical protein